MDGSRIVTPSRMCASLSRTRRLHSAAASCERSLMPSNRPSSSKPTALTIRPSSRASRTRSVRYSSPVTGDGSSDAIRRRSQAASKAYSPALISLPASSSGVASFASTIRSTVPNSPRTTRPSRPDRRRRRWPGRSPRRPRGAPRGSRRGRRRSRAARRRDRTRISVASSGTTASAARTASPGPRGSSWRAKAARSAKTSVTRLDRRRVDDDRRRPAAPSAVLAQASST